MLLRFSDIERLTEEEMDSIKMMTIRQFGHISVRNYERIRYSFRNKVHLLTLQVLGTRISKLSGVTPEIYDCCINTCHAFTLEYADEHICSVCGQPRFDEKGSPRQRYQFIPTIPCFCEVSVLCNRIVSKQFSVPRVPEDERLASLKLK